MSSEGVLKPCFLVIGIATGQREYESRKDTCLETGMY